MIAKKLLNNIQKRGVYVVRQSNYVAQSPIQIVNNTISLETSFIDKVNTIDNLQRDITTNTNSINGIGVQLTTINNNISTNTQQIETINTTLPNKLDTATFNSEKANFAKLNVENTFNANQNINGTGDILTLKRTNDSSFGMDLLTETNTRVGYFGTRENEPNEATVWGKNGLLLQSTGGKVWVGTSGYDFQWESTRDWSQNVDNTLVRTKDFKYVKKWEYTSNLVQPNNNWNTTSWNWTMSGINTNGIHEFVICISTADNTLFTFNPKIMWKNGLTISNSNKFVLDKMDNGVDEFVFTIKTNNKFHIAHKRISGAINYNWVRCWVIRNNNLPWKVNSQW